MIAYFCKSIQLLERMSHCLWHFVWSKWTIYVLPWLICAQWRSFILITIALIKIWYENIVRNILATHITSGICLSCFSTIYGLFFFSIPEESVLGGQDWKYLFSSLIHQCNAYPLHFNYKSLPNKNQTKQCLHQLSLELKTVGIFCVIWEGLEFYKDSYSNACHRNIGFLICQFGNIPARPLSPSTLNMTMAERSKDKKLFLYHSEPEKTKRQKRQKKRQKNRKT